MILTGILGRMGGLFRKRTVPAVQPVLAVGTIGAGGTDWHPTHRHRKGGGYRVLGHGILEADRSDVVIYDDADGTIWVRSKSEFYDGRFTPLNVAE